MHADAEQYPKFSICYACYNLGVVTCFGEGQIVEEYKVPYRKLDKIKYNYHIINGSTISMTQMPFVITTPHTYWAM